MPLAIERNYPCPAMRWLVEPGLEITLDFGRPDGEGGGPRMLPCQLNRIRPRDTAAWILELFDSKNHNCGDDHAEAT